MTLLTVYVLILFFLAFMFGGSLASFAAVVIERTKEGKPITGRSKCICGRQLKWYENIPVFSYLIQNGKSRCCKTRIPKWYFIFEILAATVFATIAWLFLNQYI